MSDSNEVITDPHLEKRTRRRFSVAEKKRLLAEADALPYGDKGAWLRRKGLYAGQLSTWRKDLAEHGEAGLASRQPGRKPADPRDRENRAPEEGQFPAGKACQRGRATGRSPKKSCTCSTATKTGTDHELPDCLAAGRAQGTGLSGTERAAPLVLSGSPAT